MPPSPDATRALEQLKQAHTRFKTAELARHEAIVTASHVGCSLREISEAMDGDLSHEVIRGIVGPRFGVAFEWDGGTFHISEPQTRALIYKADGYGRRAFPGDVEKLGVGDGWLPAALDLAEAMRRVHLGLDDEPIVLDDNHAFALFQILRMTYMNGLTPIADLRASLSAHFRPAPLARGRG